MEPITKTIRIQTTEKPRRVKAVCLGCFGVIREYIPKDHNFRNRPFVVTHLPTGLDFSRGRKFPSVEAALAFIREVSTIANWTSSEVADYKMEEDLGPKIDAILNVTCGLGRVDYGRQEASPNRPMNLHALRPCNLEA